MNDVNVLIFVAMMAICVAVIVLFLLIGNDQHKKDAEYNNMKSVKRMPEDEFNAYAVWVSIYDLNPFQDETLEMWEKVKDQYIERKVL